MKKLSNTEAELEKIVAYKKNVKFFKLLKPNRYASFQIFVCPTEVKKSKFFVSCWIKKLCSILA